MTGVHDHVEDADRSKGDPFRDLSEDGLLPRPLRPRAAWFRKRLRLRTLAGGIGVLLIGVAIALVLGFVLRSQERAALAERGALARNVTMNGEVETRAFVVRTIEMAVAYTDARGQRHYGEVSLWMLGGEIEADASVVVHYDPQHPERFVVSTELDAASGQRLVVWLLGGLLVVVGGGLLLAMRQGRVQLAQTREVILAGGHEVLLKLLGEREELTNGQHVRTVYLLALPDGTVLERDRAPADPPFVIDVAKKLVLGLQHPQRPELVALLDVDLGPLEVPPGEASRVRDRYRRRPSAE